MAEEKQKFVTFMNEGGAVHTVSEELFKREYKGRVLKLSKAILTKLAANSDKVAELADLRLNAEDADGKPDHKARQQAARDWQKAQTESKEYRMSLVADD